MKILFVTSANDILSPDKPLRTPNDMQLGISYISSLLKNHAHHTRLVILSRILGRKNKKTID
ncbi:MAG: hypothetical protein ABIG11_00305, partial [bacterium]